MIDAEMQEIVPERLTMNDAHDTVPVAKTPNEQKSPVDRFYSDGIFDAWNTYDTLDDRKIGPESRLAFCIPDQESRSSLGS